MSIALLYKDKKHVARILLGGMRQPLYAQCYTTPMRTILKERYPQYLAPPPLTDDRPNETSWEVFKKRQAATGEKK